MSANPETDFLCLVIRICQVTKPDLFPQVFGACNDAVTFHHRALMLAFKTWLTFRLSADLKSSQGEKQFLNCLLRAREEVLFSRFSVLKIILTSIEISLCI